MKKIKKNMSRGGGVLLKKHGPKYFKELANKRAAKQSKAVEFYDKQHKTKSKKG